MVILKINLLKIYNFSILAPLKIEVVRAYAGQIINILEYLNSMGVIHRDLKPENMMLDKDLNINIVYRINYR